MLAGGTVLALLKSTEARTTSARRPVAASTAPTLLAVAHTTRAIAVDSITQKPEPFAAVPPVSFGSDNRTRVMLFATNLTLGSLFPRLTTQLS